MKRFIPLILWFLLSVPFLYYVRNHLIYKFPAYSSQILILSIIIVFAAFFIVKNYAFSRRKDKEK